MIVSTRPWKLIFLSTAFVVVAFLLSFSLLTSEQQRAHRNENAKNAKLMAQIVANQMANDWPDLHTVDTAKLRDELRNADMHVAVVTTDGNVRFDSDHGIWTENLIDSEEVQQALRTGEGLATRPLHDDGPDHAAAAARIEVSGKVVGVAWVARPYWTLTGDFFAFGRVLAVAAGLIAALTVAMAVVLLRERRRVLTRLVRGARRLSQGDLHSDIEIGGSDELALLSSSLNIVRRRLAAQVETIDRQRRTLEALVNQLHEGVVVTRHDGRIALVNPAAARLLNLKLGNEGIPGLVGRPVEECIPQHPLQQLLLDTAPAAAPEPVSNNGHGKAFEDGFVVADDRDRKPIAIEGGKRTSYLLADASLLSLTDPAVPEGDTPGRVLVLTDVTEMQRTIQLRTDFVANASHELRTPLSTIRAAVETLLAMDLENEHEAARNFLQAINRHSARLEHMVSDLLDLSRLESPAKEFEPELISMRHMLDELYTRFAEALERKRIRWETDTEPASGGSLYVSPQLLRLAVDNLVDNATKFTEEAGTIRVTVRRLDQRAEVEVADDGCGIPPEEQQRVFERFYQVERGRSGVERGTGLGLSIVRHAVGALRGSVQLDSTVGAGTRVTISIPQPDEELAAASQRSEVLTP